jgi:hypothetical protein
MHAIAFVRIPFLFMDELYSIVYINPILFIQSSVNGYPLLAIVNGIAKLSSM